MATLATEHDHEQHVHYFDTLLSTIDDIQCLLSCDLWLSLPPAFLSNRIIVTTLYHAAYAYALYTTSHVYVTPLASDW